MKKKYLALLTATVLLLTLLTACGGETEAPAPDPAPAPAETEEPAPPPPASDPAPAETGPAPSEGLAPGEEPPAGEEDPVPVEAPPDEPAPAPSGSTPEPDPQPEPEPEPEPAPAPEPAESVPEDGTYTAAVTLEGGTGRATIESPAVLHCENGRFRAVIVWSSPNFDYMKVDGEKYELTSEPGGNSTFEIPVSAFDQKLDVIADTVAMSEPHEVEYTLYFDSATLQKQ